MLRVYGRCTPMQATLQTCSSPRVWSESRQPLRWERSTRFKSEPRSAHSFSALTNRSTYFPKLSNDAGVSAATPTGARNVTRIRRFARRFEQREQPVRTQRRSFHVRKPCPVLLCYLAQSRLTHRAERQQREGGSLVEAGRRHRGCMWSCADPLLEKWASSLETTRPKRLVNSLTVQNCLLA